MIQLKNSNDIKPVLQLKHCTCPPASKSNKFWLLLLGGLVAASVVVMILLWQVPVSNVRIYKEGEIITTINLLTVNQPYTYTVEGMVHTGGVSGLNIVEIDHGRVRMQKADCPDGYCVRQGWINSGLVPVVCLPNRVVIAFESGTDNTGIDAVVG